jgi:hypothetical protein
MFELGCTLSVAVEVAVVVCRNSNSRTTSNSSNLLRPSISRLRLLQQCSKA